ncbi:MAG: indolepyruvate ferredoxin oxidoreductase family protein [Gemmatimonadales bacterium]
MPRPGPGALSLDDKYLLEEGRIALSGVQALVRVPIDQHLDDRRAGLRTATLISGYRGSPLGGYDFLLQSAADVLARHHIRFLPGVNEDLGATAVFGSQLANLLPGARYDGVVGIWYGKGPGVDRSGDAFKHANLTGVGRHGGVLVVAGDDPASKSSTLPSASEVALFDAQMPVLFPADVQGVLDLGSAGIALSRYAGLWTGLKVTTNVADEFSTALVGPGRRRWVRPEFEFRGKPWQATQSHTLFAPYNLQLEQELWEGRLEAARRFAAANGLIRMPVNPAAARLGIVAAGKTWLDVREALTRLGLTDDDLERLGVRLLEVRLLYPLEPEAVRRFAAGLEEILVIEEKRSFLELLLRDVLFNQPGRPRVVGKRDEQDRLLVPGHGELEADTIAPILAARLAGIVGAEALAGRLERFRPALPPEVVPLGLPAQRLSYFCSGCPHNRSTVVPEGSIAAVGIGCHGMAVTMERAGAGFTQMGGEGAQWVGASFFTETPHLFQNLGDGTLFHSGSLAIRQAVAAGTSITYKVLYNGAVAMTGGQPADGALAVPELTRSLLAEGVQRIVVLTDEPDRYRGVSLAPGTEVWSRDRLDEAQRLLREIAGVTVLIYDQHCAADLRRRRKRGQAPERPLRIFINERICEGCGDCGVKSNCLSVMPVDTEFGRKTRIHQSSCNTDYSCLDGDCPAFVTAAPRSARPARRAAATAAIPADLPLPPPGPRAANLYLMGIGGTGVVTVNQILGTAALLDGKSFRSLDQTGLSQKGGAVVSHLKIGSDGEVSNKIGVGEIDGYVGFDILTAADARHLARATPARTVAVVSSSRVPTGLMVRNAAVEFPADSLLHRRIDAATRARDNVFLDAERLADRLFGTHLAANVIVIGAAWQRGLIPLSAGAIEQAIRLNGAAVDTNLAAFRAGRAAVAMPAWAEEVGAETAGSGTTTPDAGTATAIERIGASGELARLLAIRIPDLVAYQNEAYAARYAAFVQRVAVREREVTGGSALAEAVARSLHKLMAYKDEYEVARLALDSSFSEALAASFGADTPFRFRFHPPLLRRLGLKRKLAFGPWFKPVLGLLRRLRGLRGTALDPFGRDRVRREERRLIGEYRDTIEALLPALGPDTVERAAAIARLPDLIRGYEGVKLASIDRYRARLAELTRPPVQVEAPAAVP